MIEHPSPNCNERRGDGGISMLVLHYTGMRHAQDALARLCDPAAQVSAHYLIDADGTLYHLVSEADRAWHAGVSYWRGERDVNSRSIGIELHNPGHEYGYTPFPEPQIATLIDLCQGILKRHPIPPAGIVGHSDIAPDRKQDPGELFPWQRLAGAGVGVFPDATAPTTGTGTGMGTAQTAMPTPEQADVNGLLTRIGYDPVAVDRIAAFQRRFRPARIDGIADGDCARLATAYLSALTATLE